MEHELLHTTLLHAFEDRIRKYIPTITILRQPLGGGLDDVTVPLNVYRNERETDKITGQVHNPEANANCFPFVFIRQEQRLTIGSRVLGEGVTRYDYSYLISVDFYIDQEPNNLARVPRMREELDKIDLLLERVLQNIELFTDFAINESDIYETAMQSSTRVLE